MANAIAVRFGRRVQGLRTKRGWSQSYLAEISGVNRSHLSEIENGKRDPGLSLVEILATSFELTVAELLKGV